MDPARSQEAARIRAGFVTCSSLHDAARRWLCELVMFSTQRARHTSSFAIALAVIAITAPLVGGCAANPSSDDVDSDTDALVTENSNDKIAFDFFLAKGL